MQFSLGETLAVSDPLLDLRNRVRGRHETGRYDVRSRRQQVGQYTVALAVGDRHLDSLVRHLARHAVLGQHPSPPELRATGLNIPAQIVAVRLDRSDDGRSGIGRIAVIYSVYIAQNDQGLGIHHRRDQARKLVVVGEHQLGYRDRIVLVDDRNHAVIKHDRHAVLLIQVMAPGRKALFGRQHLAAEDAAVAHQLVIAIDQLDLSDGREQLARRDRVELALRPQLAAARGHGSGRNQYDLDSPPMQLRDLVGKRRHARRIERTVIPRQHIAAHLDNHPSESISFHKIFSLPLSA